MKPFYKQLLKLLVVSVLLIPNLAWSQSGLLANGIIDKVGSSFITISDSRFKLLPTVKVILKDKKPGKVSDLKKGDFVKLELLKVNKRKQVDTIRVVSEL